VTAALAHNYDYAALAGLMLDKAAVNAISGAHMPTKICTVHLRVGG
jgi:hypothetical protein